MTTATPTQSTRWTEITAIWKDNRWLYVIAGALLGILATPAIEQITGNLSDLIGNLVPEAVGIIFTVLILDRLAANRAVEELKHRLVLEAGSRSNNTAVSAIEWIRAEGWLTTDDEVQSLKGVNLQETNLQGANLVKANLQGANLIAANLQNANLIAANLQEAKLWSSNLQEANLGATNLDNASLDGASLKGAFLSWATLEGADLENANLEEVNLGGANLQGANLRYANLRGASLIETVFDNKVLLPDAIVVGSDDKGNNFFDKYWTPDTDMTRYTNPKHPGFWEPEWVKEQHEQGSVE